MPTAQLATAPVALNPRPGSPVEIDWYVVPSGGGHGKARADALLPVIERFGCPVVLHGDNAAPALVMTGTRPALDALELLLPEIATRMECSARVTSGAFAAGFRDWPGGPRWRTLVRPYFRDYLRGYGAGVSDDIRELRANLLAAEGPELASIVAEDRARVQAIFHRELPGEVPLQPDPANQARAHAAGYRAGLTAGVGDPYLAIHDLVFAML